MKKILLLLLLPLVVSAQNKPVQASRTWIAKEGPNILQTYSQLLSLPNHASDLVNIRKNANMLKDLFSARGFAMQLLELDGAPPIVYRALRWSTRRSQHMEECAVHTRVV
jgi:hypothetical protein